MVSKVRMGDNTVLATFGVGTNPAGIAFDGANMWVVNSGAKLGQQGGEQRPGGANGVRRPASDEYRVRRETTCG